MSGWGPQARAVAVPPPPVPVAPAPGVTRGRAVAAGLLWVGLLIGGCVAGAVAAPDVAAPDCFAAECYEIKVGGESLHDRYERLRAESSRTWWATFAPIAGTGTVALLVGLGMAEWWARRRAAAYQRAVQAAVPPSDQTLILGSGDPFNAACWASGREYGAPGGHAGWVGAGMIVSANPRGGVLVIGPPGSGKTSAVIIPSVLVAPGCCVSTSIKDDVMAATAAARSLRGRLWHFDPGGETAAAAGVTPARWSPLAAVASWDDARRIASRMAEPARAGDGAHFIDRARDWLEILLFAAHLRGEPIATVANWAQNAAADDVSEPVLTALIQAQDGGDDGAGIAARQLEGLLTIPDRERGSVLSTLARLLRVYGSTAARNAGNDPNFDPAAFVRSGDTLYITAAPDKQHEYAPLLVGLLEEIRYATYARHRAEAAGAEPKRPHATWVLDEANNTAPVPLPAIISEAGGQSLHVIVGIQDLSRARARWGQEADGFLTLFPTKLVLRGVVEPYTLDALSNAAGEYDRLMIGYTKGIQPLPYGAMETTSPSYSISRQKVLTQGDIATPPDGHALLFQAGGWTLVRVGMHWQHPVWQAVDTQARHLTAPPAPPQLPAPPPPQLPAPAAALTKECPLCAPDLS